MQLSSLEDIYFEVLKDATATVKKVKRDYRAALARIKRAEKFLTKNVEGLGYESEQWGALYGAEPFTYPPRTAVYNGGLGRVAEQTYILFFAHDGTDWPYDDAGWHFRIAPTLETESGVTIQDNKSMRLIDAPAGIVLCCAANIESNVVEFLDFLAATLAASYDGKPAKAAPRMPARPPETGSNIAPMKGVVRDRIN
ncbi:hypothetical protein [Sorangium sp. So ce1182]|uniref:hypothetical protein n=1 Tax=Sorangium sp. So ce1182 TaxID=3133334 RepID=UPI003F5FA81B